MTRHLFHGGAIGSRGIPISLRTIDDQENRLPVVDDDTREEVGCNPAQRLGQRVNIRDRGIHALHKKGTPLVSLFPRIMIEVTPSFSVVKNDIRIERLNELHIPLARLRTSVDAILGQHGVEWPALDFAETGDDAASAVPALIAVQVERSESHVVCTWPSLLGAMSMRKRVMAADLGIVSISHEFAQKKGGLLAEGDDLQDRADIQTLEELEVAILWEGAAEENAGFDGSVVGREGVRAPEGGEGGREVYSTAQKKRVRVN
ncbi:hypothetical protein KC326_g218 [Hortaea werneckii]|nr:hypothetical protein KC326_g218 [Hortaea werneckii]